MRVNVTVTQGLYARLSAFYFFYFASIGAFIPYWGLFLKQLSFDPRQIGELMAIVMATKIVAPNIWGWMADHSGRRLGVIRIGTLGALVTFAGVLWSPGYWWLALVMAVFSFFWHAALPQFEATTLDHLGGHTHRYGRIRLWGSIGFIVSVVGLAPFFEHLGVEWLPQVMLGLLVIIWINTLWVPEGDSRHAHQRSPSLTHTLKQPAVIALLTSCFFLQASHGPYYAFFTIYLEEQGYQRSVVGQLWALGVVAEVIIFLLMHRWLPRFGPRKLLLCALAISIVRWILTATLVQSVFALLLAQSMHAASYGVYHAAAIELIHRLFPGRLQGRGQALYASLSFGLGGALGSLLSGHVWTGLGPEWVYVLAAVLASLGLIVAWAGVKLPPVTAPSATQLR